MKNAAKLIAVFLAGAGVGCIGSYLYLKKKFDNDVIFEVTKEVEKLRAEKNGESNPEKSPEYENKVPDPEDLIEVKTPTGLPNYIQKNVTVTDYTKMAIKNNIDIPEDVDVSEIVSHENTEKPIAHLIAVDKYEDLFNDHKSESLLYYSDGTITDDYDNVWYRSLDQFIPNATTDDFDSDGYMYAEKEGLDGNLILYEIVKQNISYNEATGKE